MKTRKVMVTAMALFVTASSGVRAEATCESVRTDLTGQNLFGQHTMKELSNDAQAGNCTAASGLVRRARDAQGFLQTHCQADTDLQAVAAAEFDVGQRTLRTTACKN